MKLNYCSEAKDCLITVFEWLKMKCKKLWSVLSSTRFLISAITTVLVTAGLALLTVGIVVFVMCGKYSMFVEDTYYLLTAFVIVTAVIIFCTALLGYHGVTREKYYFVVAYVTLLATILVSEIVITVYGSILTDNAATNSVILYEMYKSQQNYYVSWGGYGYQEAWDNIQNELYCCGLNGVRDWGLRIPLSCCNIPVGATSPFECSSENAHYGGCRPALGWYLARYAFAIEITGAIVTCFQVIIIAVAVYIAYRLKPQQETPYKGLLDSPMDHASKYYSQYQAIPGQSVRGSHSNDIIQ